MVARELRIDRHVHWTQSSAVGATIGKRHQRDPCLQGHATHGGYQRLDQVRDPRRRSTHPADLIRKSGRMRQIKQCFRCPAMGKMHLLRWSNLSIDWKTKIQTVIMKACILLVKGLVALARVLLLARGDLLWTPCMPRGGLVVGLPMTDVTHRSRL